MSYNSLSRPRFYINTIESLYNKGFINSVNPIFLSSNWHKPQILDGEILSVSFNRYDLLIDTKYILFMGCSDDTLINIDLDNNPTSIYNLNDDFNDPEFDTGGGRDINTYNTAYEGTSFIIMGISDNEFMSTNEIDITISGSISGISIGNYFDLPYNPDLGIEKTISYENTNTVTTIGGKTFSSNYGNSKPYNLFSNYLGESNVPYDESFTMADVQSNISTGRRLYDISYSYIGESSDGQNHLFPRDFNYSNDIANINHNMQYDDSKNNLYTSVINKTQGSHIPFVFSLNGSNSNELMLARFTNKSFKSTEQAPNVHNISFGIREVW